LQDIPVFDEPVITKGDPNDPVNQPDVYTFENGDVIQMCAGEYITREELQSKLLSRQVTLRVLSKVMSCKSTSSFDQLILKELETLRIKQRFRDAEAPLETAKQHHAMAPKTVAGQVARQDSCGDWF